jgi:cytochrome c oxidase assembly factor CtaG
VNGASPTPSRTWVAPLRVACAVAGLIVIVLVLVPPMWGAARRDEWAQALQFVVLAFLGPSLLAVGAPWDRLGRGGPVGRWATRRRPERGESRLVGTAFVFIVVSVLWRSAPAVNALLRHGALVALEALTLVVAGLAFQVELVESPPLRACPSRPYRIGATAAVMWSAWVVAYLAGMSHSQWYGGFRHVAGRGISAVADQQISAAIVWFVTAAIFVPIIFWNLMHWLQSEEDPNVELVRLVREEREQRFFGSRGRSGTGQA